MRGAHAGTERAAAHVAELPLYLCPEDAAAASMRRRRPRSSVSGKARLPPRWHHAPTVGKSTACALPWERLCALDIGCRWRVLRDPACGGNDVDASLGTGAGARHVDGVDQYWYAADELDDGERA